MINYKTYSDLSKDIRQSIHKIPKDVTLIVGIPRSGMVPAYMISAFLNLPVATLGEYINNITPLSGCRPLNLKKKRENKILIVDDTVSNGINLKRTKELLKKKKDKAHYIFYAVYTTEKSKDLVDIFGTICEQTRIFQWNYFHHDILSRACIDIDGVLCKDPTEKENDDGEEYKKFILNALPLFLTNFPIKALVTSRLEKYREPTEKWLKKHDIHYNDLYMLDLPSKEERIKQNAHAKFKADLYTQLKDTELFIESDREQAAKIALLTSKPVMCITTDEIFPVENNDISSTELEIQTLKHELIKKNKTIQMMELSKFWKLRSYYIFLKRLVRAESLRKNKIAVYTAIFGDYDSLKEPPQIEGCDFFCFTDDPNLSSKKYKIVVCKRRFKDPTRDARMYKILSHKFLPEYKYTLWIDGTVQIKEGFDMKNFIKRYLKKQGLAIFKHPERDCVYQEVKACKKLNKDDPKVMDRQIRRYKKERYPENNGLVGSGIILRKNRSKRVMKINEDWWSELENNSKRDQLSFNYVCWKNHFNYGIIDTYNGFYWDNEFFRILPHNK